MEALALKTIVLRLQQLPQIVGYVHDNDGKARNIVQQAEWEMPEFLDRGHAKKSFLRCCQNFEREYQDSEGY